MWFTLKCVDIVHSGLRGREDNLEPQHPECDGRGLRPVQLPRREHRGGGVRPDYIRETGYQFILKCFQIVIIDILCSNKHFSSDFLKDDFHLNLQFIVCVICV